VSTRRSDAAREASIKKVKERADRSAGPDLPPVKSLKLNLSENRLWRSLFYSIVMARINGAESDMLETKSMVSTDSFGSGFV
jgi:hypothetical protein